MMSPQKLSKTIHECIIFHNNMPGNCQFALWCLPTKISKPTSLKSPISNSLHTYFDYDYSINDITNILWQMSLQFKGIFHLQILDTSSSQVLLQSIKSDLMTSHDLSVDSNDNFWWIDTGSWCHDVNIYVHMEFLPIKSLQPAEMLITLINSYFLLTCMQE